MMTNCTECNKAIVVDDVDGDNLCEACYDYYYCECGRRLCEEEGSSPGDGLCRKCD